jgi:hypothetical protein
MDANRPRLPPDLYRTTQYKRRQETKRKIQNTQHQTHTSQHIQPRPHATETSSAPIGASSPSQAKTPSNEEQQLALARFILTGAQNHGAASFCSCAWQAEETTTTTGEWCVPRPRAANGCAAKRRFLLVPCLPVAFVLRCLLLPRVPVWRERDCYMISDDRRTSRFPPYPLFFGRLLKMESIC